LYEILRVRKSQEKEMSYLILARDGSGKPSSRRYFLVMALEGQLGFR
jgi:hypothetical protein